MPRRRTLNALAERKRRQSARRRQTTEQRNVNIQRLSQRMYNHRQEQSQQAIVQRRMDLEPSYVLRLSSDVNARRTQEKLPKTYCCARLGISVEPHSIGRMDQQCLFCTAKLYAGVVITHLGENIITVKLIDSGKIAIIPRIKLTPSDPTVPFRMTRKQFPLKVAFAMTINKAQGQTFDKAGL